MIAWTEDDEEVHKAVKREKRKWWSPWTVLAYTATLAVPSPVLKCAGMHDRNRRFAFRQKLALCILIALLCSLIGFLSFGMTAVLCPLDQTPTIVYSGRPLPPDVLNIRGRVYVLRDLPQMAYYLPEHDDCRMLRIKCVGCRPYDKRLSTIRHRRLVVPWSRIQADPTLFVYNGAVINGTAFNVARLAFQNPTIEKILGSDLSDVTQALATVPGGKGLEAGKCLVQWFKVGELASDPIPCLLTRALTMTLLLLLTALILVKFLMALCFSWFMASRQRLLAMGKTVDDDELPLCIVLVTCYSEDEAALRATLDSVSRVDYPSDRLLLFIVADGMVTGSGSGESTPMILKRIMTIRQRSAGQLSYYSIGQGDKRINTAVCCAGDYKGVPALLITKVGTAQEQQASKPGNRGKRDSQLVLMGALQRLLFNDLMFELDYGIVSLVYSLTETSLADYEYVLMVDADTRLHPSSVKTLVMAAERDEKVMGLCGETLVENRWSSWVTAIQVFEYYISHHLGKAFESVFGGVTCLPGCFCMYRVKASKGAMIVPLLASPDIIDSYSRAPNPRSLHQQNLLLLGEDRYLTTLMLKTFPKRKLIFVPSAKCYTTVPDRFRVLLSQRRRWINSTVHNLAELLTVNDLCGIFCCSMQFVVFIELIGTLVLPAAIAFTGYLVYGVVKDPVANLAPLILLLLVLGLPSVLVLVTSLRPELLLWMLIYLLALPVWNLLLPLYAYWHFDDISWGQTRKTATGDSGHDPEPDATYSSAIIPRKKWTEWVDARPSAI